MKISFSLILLFFALTLYGQSREEAAIKKAIAAETTAYMNRDYAAWASHWDASKEISFLVTNLDMRSSSWEYVSANMKADMESNSTPIPATLETSDFDIAISGNQAFVVYVQTMRFEGQENKTYEVRNLRKVKGQWKLSAMISSAAGEN